MKQTVLEASVMDFLAYKEGSLFPLNSICTQKSLIEKCLTGSCVLSRTGLISRGFEASLGGQTITVSTCPSLLRLIWWCSCLVFLQVRKYATTTGEALHPVISLWRMVTDVVPVCICLCMCEIESRSFPCHLL